MSDDPTPRIIPYLYYQDVAGALDWLAKAFGLEPFGTTMTGADGKLSHAAMRLDDGLVMMGHPGPEYRNPKQLGHETQSLYVHVDDVDQHYERAKNAGAVILEEPATTDYGARRYGAADPEGHHWYFAEPL